MEKHLSIHKTLGFIIVFLIIIAFSSIFKLYWTHYWEPTTLNGAYSHAPLALLVFFFLIWRRRYLLRIPVEKGCAPVWGYALFLSGVLIKIHGEIHGYSVLRGMTLIPILFGILIIKYPCETVKNFLFPVFFLLFVIPLPTFVIDQITIPLVDIITQLAADALDFLNYQANRSGYVITVQSFSTKAYHEIVINGDCSGIRSMVALLALCSLYVHLQKLDAILRFGLVLAVIPLSILGNLCRVLITVFMVLYINPKTAQSFFHEFSGIVVFGLTLGGLFFLEKILRRLKIAVKSGA